MIGVTAIALAFAAHAAFATSAGGVEAHNGVWLSPHDPSPYKISGKGMAGVDRKNCGAGYRHKASLDEGAAWLAVIADAEKAHSLPPADAQMARKAVQKDQRYPRVAFLCQGYANDGLLIAPDTRLVMSCVDGTCEVSRHVRAR